MSRPLGGGLPPALVTYGWCRVAYVALHSLAARGVPVHVVDASALAMCRFSRRCRSFTRARSPFADPDGYADDLAAALRRTGAEVLLPGHEDALVLARRRARLGAAVRLPVGDPDLLARVTNKWTLLELARASGVETPAACLPRSRAELLAHARERSYPAVVKPQLGNSAKGVSVVRGAGECVERFDALVAAHALPPARWPMVQDFAPGAGYGVCLLYAQGRFRAAFCERYLRAKDGALGTSVYRESVSAPALVERARALFDGLGWHGVAHLDFLYDEATGRAALLEVNPRFWGALDLAVRAGVDFPWLLYRLAVDGDVAPVDGYRVGVRSRWALGEAMHVVNHARRGRLGAALAALRAIAGERADGWDDFRAGDPLPLVAQALDYGARLVATRSANPIEPGMVG